MKGGGARDGTCASTFRSCQSKGKGEGGSEGKRKEDCTCAVIVRAQAQAPARVQIHEAGAERAFQDSSFVVVARCVLKNIAYSGSQETTDHGTLSNMRFCFKNYGLHVLFDFALSQFSRTTSEESAQDLRDGAARGLQGKCDACCLLFVRTAPLGKLVFLSVVVHYSAGCRATSAPARRPASHY